MFRNHAYPQTLLALFLLVMLNLSATAAPPQSISYQAYLKDNAGLPVTATPSITFRLYDVAAGGTPLWTDTLSVTVTDGLFSVALGRVGNPLPKTAFGNPLWLGVEIGTDGEAVPRQTLNAAGNAFRSEDADTVGGLTATTLDQSAHAADTTSNPHNVTAAQVGAATAADITTHAGDASAHHAKTTTFTEMTDSIADAQIPAAIARDTEVAAVSAALAALQAQVTTLQASVTQLQADNTALQAKLQYLTVTGTDMFITGANLHVRSGSGATDGAVNGLGNLIVGYDEPRLPSNAATCSLGEYTSDTECTSNGGVWAISHKSGSHNIVVGVEQNYSRHSGLVAGGANTISGEFASVTGGVLNTASGFLSSISGGSFGKATGEGSWIGGGSKNIASGIRGVVSGGVENIASGQFTAVSGGKNNQTIGYASVVAGGGGPNATDGNFAVANYSAILGGLNGVTGDGACAFDSGLGRVACTAGSDQSIGIQGTISGGVANNARGEGASVSGGTVNIAGGYASSVSGGGDNDATGSFSTVSAGRYNVASGEYSSISGGGSQFSQFNNQATGDYSSISGGSHNTTSGERASISGGNNGTASGLLSSISGGDINQAVAIYSSILGGNNNLAGDGSCSAGVCTAGTDSNIGSRSTVTGGTGNQANGIEASVSGGYNNVASGPIAVVSGGNTNTASGAQASVSGGYTNTASGSSSSVSGGFNGDVTGLYDWRAGTLFEDD